MRAACRARHQPSMPRIRYGARFLALGLADENRPTEIESERLEQLAHANRVLDHAMTAQLPERNARGHSCISTAVTFRLVARATTDAYRPTCRRYRGSSAAISASVLKSMTVQPSVSSN